MPARQSPEFTKDDGGSYNGVKFFSPIQVQILKLPYLSFNFLATRLILF